MIRQVMLAILVFEPIYETFQLCHPQQISSQQNLLCIQIETSRNFCIKQIRDSDGNIFKFECLTSSVSSFLQEIQSYYLQNGIEQSEIQTDESVFELLPYNVRKNVYSFPEMNLFSFVLYEFEI